MNKFIEPFLVIEKKNGKIIRNRSQVIQSDVLVYSNNNLRTTDLNKSNWFCIRFVSMAKPFV